MEEWRHIIHVSLTTAVPSEYINFFPSNIFNPNQVQPLSGRSSQTENKSLNWVQERQTSSGPSGCDSLGAHQSRSSTPLASGCSSGDFSFWGSNPRPPASLVSGLSCQSNSKNLRMALRQICSRSLWVKRNTLRKKKCICHLSRLTCRCCRFFFIYSKIRVCQKRFYWGKSIVVAVNYQVE